MIYFPVSVKIGNVSKNPKSFPDIELEVGKKLQLIYELIKSFQISYPLGPFGYLVLTLTPLQFSLT